MKKEEAFLLDRGNILVETISLDLERRNARLKIRLVSKLHTEINRKDKEKYIKTQ